MMRRPKPGLRPIRPAAAERLSTEELLELHERLARRAGRRRVQ